jgi:hypothetical protein
MLAKRWSYHRLGLAILTLTFLWMQVLHPLDLPGTPTIFRNG